MKKAFTMLELIFVLVVIGILAAVMIPEMKSNSLREAAIQMISHIRYTQHLALVDDKFDLADNEWYKERWQFIYGKSDSSSRDSGGYYAYTIFSDTSHAGKPDPSEMAINPLDKSRFLSGGYSGTIDWEDSQATKKLNIGYSYGVDNITYSGCSGQRISFDNLGRPYVGDDKNWNSISDGILTNQCVFTLHKSTDSVSIYIEPETGYVHL